MSLLTLLSVAHSTFLNIRYEHTDYAHAQVMVALGWTTGEWWLDITEHVVCDVSHQAVSSHCFLPPTSGIEETCQQHCRQHGDSASLAAPLEALLLEHGQYSRSTISFLQNFCSWSVVMILFTSKTWFTGVVGYENKSVKCSSWSFSDSISVMSKRTKQKIH